MVQSVSGPKPSNTASPPRGGLRRLGRQVAQRVGASRATTATQATRAVYDDPPGGPPLETEKNRFWDAVTMAGLTSLSVAGGLALVVACCTPASPAVFLGVCLVMVLVPVAGTGLAAYPLAKYLEHCDALKEERRKNTFSPFEKPIVPTVDDTAVRQLEKQLYYKNEEHEFLQESHRALEARHKKLQAEHDKVTGKVSSSIPTPAKPQG